MQQSIDRLLIHACPAIQYRIRAEILGESRACADMQRLAAAILQDARVQYVLSWQQEDGYLGEVFHSGLHDRIPQRPSTRGMEGAIRFLIEMGIDHDHPVLAAALTALRRDDWFRDHMGVCWTHYPTLGMYGLDFVRAVTLAVAGVEDDLLVVPHEEASVETLRGILPISTMADIIEVFQDRNVFKAGVRFPESYHLKLLGRTRRWKTAKNLEIVTRAITRLIDFSPLPVVKVRLGSRWLGPAAIYPRNLKPRLHAMSAKEWPGWFHTFEMFACMGIVLRVTELRRQLGELQQLLKDGDGLFTMPVDAHRARWWSPYTGLALESEWTDKRMAYDLTFRCLLILHATGMIN